MLLKIGFSHDNMFVPKKKKKAVFLQLTKIAQYDVNNIMNGGCEY